MQCRVVVDFHGPEFAGTVYDVTGEQKGTASDRLEKKNDVFVIKGLPLDVAIFYQDDVNNPVTFQYGTTPAFSDINVLKFFAWESNQQGVSDQFNPDGSYCKIQVKSIIEKSIDCYFPCAGA